MLDEYKKKRDFKKTKEPTAKGIKKKDNALIFVIQKHNATRLHFDFRLEYKGVLLSWAVPRGLSENPGDKRLAVMTEDHPLDYANFHGTIPEGQYGAGTVEIWDKGKYVNITIKDGKVMPLHEAIAKGHFKIYIKGKKIIGSYAMVRMEGKNWIIIREKEDSTNLGNEVKVHGQSVAITNPEKEIDKGIVKGALIQYYVKIAPIMLQHVIDRPVSMFRFPDGVNGEKFFQKNMPDYFPKWIPCKEIQHGSKKTCYPLIKNQAAIVYLANYMAVPHITASKASHLDKPDKMIFDLDPSESNTLEELKHAAESLGDFLRQIGLRPYIMTTGGKGYHIAAPIKPELDNTGVRDFALKISTVLADSNPRLTTEIRKEKRVGKIFIDVNRISSMQTSVAPYAARSSPGLPIASPFYWDELPNVDPKYFTIKNPPKEDAWRDFFKKPSSLKQVIKKLK